MATEAKSVLVLLTLDDGALLMNAPDKPPRLVKSLEALVTMIEDPALRPTKSVPGFDPMEFFKGLGRSIAEIGRDDKAGGE